LVTVWNVSTGGRKQTLFGLRRSVQRIAISPDGKTLAVAHEGGMISAWDTSDWFRLWVTDGKDAEVLAFSAQDRSLLSAGSRAPIFRWNADSGELRDVFPCSEYFGVSTIGADLQGFYLPVRRATRSREKILQN
jgi:WD40 repeat protein